MSSLTLSWRDDPLSDPVVWPAQWERLGWETELASESTACAFSGLIRTEELMGHGGPWWPHYANYPEHVLLW